MKVSNVAISHFLVAFFGTVFNFMLLFCHFFDTILAFWAFCAFCGEFAFLVIKYPFLVKIILAQNLGRFLKIDCKTYLLSTSADPPSPHILIEI